MAASIVKLAPPDLVKQSIIDLNEPTKSGAVEALGASSTDKEQSSSQPQKDVTTNQDNQPVASSANGSVSTGDLVECRHWLQRWLDSVVEQTLPKFLDKSQLSPNRLRNLASTLGLSTRLACAIHHYFPRSVHSEQEPIEVCFSHYRSALLSGSTAPQAELREALLQDDLANGTNVSRLIRAQLTSSKQSPIPSFHLIEQLAIDPRFRSLTPAQELRLIAEFYHWLSAPPTVPSTDSSGVRLPPNSPSPAFQNGVLRKLVKSSGLVARPARPAHPNSRPIALLNTSTVEKLVVGGCSGQTHNETVIREAETTTAGSADPDSVTATTCSPNGWMNTEPEPTDALLADLARVASGDPEKPASSGSTGAARPSGYFVAPQTDSSSVIPVDSSPLTRNKLYATFCKRPTPSVSDKLPIIGSPTQKSIPPSANRSGISGVGPSRPAHFSSPQHIAAPGSVSGIPSLRSEFEKRRRSRSTLCVNQSTESVDGRGLAKTPNSNLPRGTTTWATTGGTRQSSRKTNVPDSTVLDNAISSTNGASSTAPVSRSAVAALRLSLDQRRRAIEVGRQRALVVNNQAAAQRNHVAFQKLLQSEQRRRAKKEEADTSDLESQSTAVVSQSDGDHVISSSAIDQSVESPTQLNGSAVYDADHSISASQREQVTDVDEDFSVRSTDVAPTHVRTPSQARHNNFTSEDDQHLPEHRTPEPDLVPVQTATQSNQLGPKSSKPASPTSDRDLVRPNASAPSTPVQPPRSSGSSPREPDQSSSEAMEYLVSVASEQPIRSASPTAEDWYRTMPQRRGSSGDTQPVTSKQQQQQLRANRLAMDERFPSVAPPTKLRGLNHPVRSVPQPRRSANTPGLSASQQASNARRRREQPQHSAGAYRRHELTSQSLSVEPRDSQLLMARSIGRGPSRSQRRRAGANPLAASVNYEYSGTVARSVDPEWDEPGDDECEDELLVERNGIYDRVSRGNASYGDDDDDVDDADYEDLVDGGHGPVMYDDDGSYSDSGGHSRSHRPWHDVDRFSSERSSIAYSTSGRRSNRSYHRKHDLLRASYDPSHAGLRRSPRPIPAEAALVDAETLDKLNRNLMELQSGLERLSAQQQQVLLASSSATAAAALVAGAQSQHAFVHPQLPTILPVPQSVQPPPTVPMQPASPAGLTRATWSERPKLCELTQPGESESGLDDGAAAHVASESERSTRSHSIPPSDTEASAPQPSSQAFFVDFNAPQRSPSPTESKAPEPPALEPTPPPSEKNPQNAPVEKAPAGQVFFIGFEEPDPQLMQRKCDRLEARRAAEKAMAAQQLEALRSTDREEKHSMELAELERKTTEKERREAILQAYLNRKEQSESQCHRLQNPYPVRPGSAALSRSSGNLSSKSGKRSASQNAPGPSLPRNSTRSSELRASRTGALRAKSATRKPVTAMDSSSCSSVAAAARGNADGEARETTDVEEQRIEQRTIRGSESAQKQRQKPNGKPTGQMTSGLSLSSLHRLGAADQPTSGPGVPVSGLSQPKLFVKPKAKSNRMVIVNAIGHCCLAGAVNEPMKQATLKELASTEGTHFMILFRDARCQYRAVYAYDLELEELRLICGTGPRKITHDMANRFFKYNSGGKHFTEITSTNHLSPVVDAITIHDALWSKSGAQAAAMNLVSSRPAP